MKAKLTDAEDRAWTHAFAFYIEEGFNDDEADQKAWADLLLEFPRLRDYEGCEP